MCKVQTELFEFLEMPEELFIQKLAEADSSKLITKLVREYELKDKLSEK